MLKKQKKLNNLSSAFTLIELLVVIIIIGIIVATLSFDFSPNRLQLAADQLIKDIRFTQSLALKDDKYQPFPKSTSAADQNQSKYWFKQWWQIRFTQNTSTNRHWWYEIFTDLPYYNGRNFDRTAHYPDNPESNWYRSIALDPLTNKLLIGNCGVAHYPDCNLTETSLDLTKKYGIVEIEFDNFDSYTKRLLFDNEGNVFLSEGEAGDSNDINPINNRGILTQTAKIKLCLDNPCINAIERCIQINITPSGAVFQSRCQ